ncbi:tryptophan-rich sensory protein [Methylobacterium aerolatum]|uniref:Tryptophan-rich sensory protein n=1 Tax=Methylobacterium aerolatum TaxID=418708 RepID=A0ABU0I0F2_9HYPH|nr:tryptophan-rich sensory protein [Methylobacterium aerolatum]GJD37053.1 Tryptophan-rich protein TspO [Methylobacterium aerolatum]
MILPAPGDWTTALVAAVCAVAVAAAGGIATKTDEWYRRLRVPAWKPPDWAFGPIWAVIFALTASSGVLAWTSAVGARPAIAIAFAVNGLLNIAWSVVFFRLRRPDWALGEIVLLWISVAALILVVGRTSAVAGWLNLPYLVWVSIAACLNLRIVQLNPRRSLV